MPYLVSVADPYDTPRRTTTGARCRRRRQRSRSALQGPGRRCSTRRRRSTARQRVETLTADRQPAARSADARHGRRARCSACARRWFRVGVLGARSTPAKARSPTGRGRSSRRRARRSQASRSRRARPAGSGRRSPVQPAADGVVPAAGRGRRRPRSTASHRRSTGRGDARVPVAPLVRFRAVADPSHRAGYEQPALPGDDGPAPAPRRRRRGRRSRRRPSTATAPSPATLALQPGTYRARFAPGHGLVAGHVAAARGRPRVRRLAAALAPRSRWPLRQRRRTQPYVPNDPLCRRSSGTCAQDHAFDFWPQPPVAAPVRVARDRLGHRRGHPDLAGQDRSRPELRRRELEGRHRGPRDVRRRDDRRGDQQRRSASPGSRFPAQLLIAKVVRAGRHDQHGGRGARDPLGGRPGRARDQPQPRRRCATRSTRRATPTRRSSRARSTTRSARARSSSPRSGTATRRRRSRGASRATRPRCRT